MGGRESKRSLGGWQNLLTCAASDVELSSGGKEIEAALLGAGIELIGFRTA